MLHAKIRQEKYRSGETELQLTLVLSAHMALPPLLIAAEPWS